MKKVVIVAPFFGSLPWYYEYFINSCSFNSTIDFLIISDISKLGPIHKNVKHIYMSLDDINMNALNKVRFNTKIKDGYKFCDFKPAYGFLFSDLIQGYDFWGQCDIDVILGDIRRFMTEDLLTDYDYFSVRHDFPTGYFSLFRNCNKMNTLFMKSKDYKRVYSDSKHYCFDECNNVHDQLTQGISIFDTDTEIESFMHVLKKAEMNNEIRAYFDFICIEGTTGRIKFDRGKILYKNKYEAILYHLIAFKKTCKMSKPTQPIPDRYNISPTRIYVNKSK